MPNGYVEKRAWWNNENTEVKHVKRLEMGWNTKEIKTSSIKVDKERKYG